MGSAHMTSLNRNDWLTPNSHFAVRTSAYEFEGQIVGLKHCIHNRWCEASSLFLEGVVWFVRGSVTQTTLCYSEDCKDFNPLANRTGRFHLSLLSLEVR